MVTQKWIAIVTMSEFEYLKTSTKINVYTFKEARMEQKKKHQLRLKITRLRKPFPFLSDEFLIHSRVKRLLSYVVFFYSFDFSQNIIKIICVEWPGKWMSSCWILPMLLFLCADCMIFNWNFDKFPCKMLIFRDVLHVIAFVMLSNFMQYITRSARQSRCL